MLRAMQDRRVSPYTHRRELFRSVVISASVSVVAFLCVLLASGFATAAEFQCPHHNVVIYAADSSDVDYVCEAAGEAIGFLAENDFNTSRVVEVHLVKKLPAEASASSYGCYDHPHRRVYMLPYLDCLERGPWASLPMDPELYKSLLAHEVAHAVAAANFAIARPSMLAHEYLAYVTMFEIMAPDEREQLLNRLPGSGFDSVDQMSVTYYLMDPLRFGAESYRHFLKLEDQKNFLKEVLSGRVKIGERGR